MSAQTLPSLRERKRLATWSALHEAALRMALDSDDLSQVTVEAIAEVANVSPRTFFNYFNSKEDAVLGIHEPELGEADAARFADTDEDELLESVVRLLFDIAYGGSFGGSEARERRRDALRRYPELFQRQFTHLMKTEQLVCQVVATWLRTVPKWQTGLLGADPEQTAQLIVMMAGSAMRMAIRHAVATNTAQDEQVALDQAVTLLKEVTRKI